MRRKIFLLILIAALAVSATGALFGCANKGDSSSDGKNPFGAHAFEGRSDIVSYIVPDYVTELGEYVFNNCAYLKSITLPEGLEKIGDHAFKDCVSLENVILPDSLTEIGEYAFENCVSLVSIDIPDGITELKCGTFETCDNLKKVTIGDKIRSIDYFAFDDCGSLEYNEYGRAQYLGNAKNPYVALVRGRSVSGGIDVHSATKIICDGAFADCNDLQQVNIQHGLVKIGKDVFPPYYLNDCKVYYKGTMREWNKIYNKAADSEYNRKNANDIYVYDDAGNFKRLIELMNSDGGAIPAYSNLNDRTLTEYTLPDGIETIGEGAFSGCSALSSLTLTEGLKYIDDGAFENCSALTSVTIPYGVKWVGENAFKGCTSLNKIVFPDGVEYIGEGALENCSALTATYLGKGLKYIDASAFSGCLSLVYEKYDNCLYLGNPVEKYLVLVKPDKDAESYRIHDENEVICGHAFSDCKELSEMIIPPDNKVVCEGAFDGCVGLSVITCPAHAVGGLDKNNLKSVTIVSEEEISDGLFSGFAALTEVVVSSTVKNVGDKAFENCTALNKAVIEDGVTEMGEGVFIGCTALKDLTIPFVGKYKSVSAEDKDNLPLGYIFGYSEVAGSEGVPQHFCKKTDGMYSITVRYFEIPSSLENLTITGGAIPAWSLDNCANIKNITLTNVTGIGDYAFAYCNALYSFTLPDCVMSVGENVFYRCDGLEEITCATYVLPLLKNSAENVKKLRVVGGETIGEYAFSSCNSLKELVIGEGVSAIDDNAFYHCRHLCKVSLPKTLISIGAFAFDDCGLTSITIPENVSLIGKNAFYGCESLLEVFNDSALDIKAGETDNGCVGYYARSITSSGDGSKVFVENGYRVFIADDGNMLLIGYEGEDKNPVLPDYITEILANVFYNFEIESVSIKRNVRSIEKNAFYGCEKIKKVYFDGSAEDWSAITFADQYSNPLCYGGELYLKQGNVYGLLTEVSLTENAEISAYAFMNASGIKKATIGGNVNSIGKNAFYGCSSLKNLELNESVVSIGDGAFAYIKNGLSGIYFKGKFKAFGKNAFNDTPVSKLYFYDHAVDWLTYTFENLGASPLKSTTSFYEPFKNELQIVRTMVVPDEVTKINDYAFYNSQEIMYLTIHAGVTEMGSLAFRNCSFYKIYYGGTYSELRAIAGENARHLVNLQCSDS